MNPITTINTKITKENRSNQQKDNFRTSNIITADGGSQMFGFKCDQKDNNYKATTD